MEQLSFTGSMITSVELEKKVTKKKAGNCDKPVMIELRKGAYMRTLFGEVLPVTKMSKPQKILIAKFSKKNKEGKNYLSNKYRDVYTITSRINNKCIFTISDHVEMCTYCMIDCIKIGDFVRLKNGLLCKIIKVKRGKVGEKKTFNIINGYQKQDVIKCSDTLLVGHSERGNIILREIDIDEVIATRFDYNRFLEKGYWVNDLYYGWSEIIRVYSGKCWCKNAYIKNPYWVNFYQIIDTRER